MPQKYIIFGEDEKGRKVTVVSGQPYYLSTGLNSYSADFWLPFIMIRGTETIKRNNFPKWIDNANLIYLLADCPPYPYYSTRIIKLDGFMVQEKYFDF